MGVASIGQRELRNDNAEIMRRVEAGESFVVTRNGRPVADLVPHVESERPRRTLAETQAEFRRLPPVDPDRWHADRRADDEVFGVDDPLADPWRG
ncbi:type II toxin-antitoxin system Phd/YefM family antitoxin [Actinosynnema sp. CS-041913]|uniref:type II toxin-antitoxin system Phd/YefM family antitoxin n=1 Tax=Actinosynnema sp. CS-041913 TaxID=3239917 RepID=UPI003D92CF0B